MISPVDLYAIDDSREWWDWAGGLYAIYMGMPDGLRNGQALMNALTQYAPDMARKIVYEGQNNKNVDPFYVNDNIPACVQRIYELFVESL